MLPLMLVRQVCQLSKLKKSWCRKGFLAPWRSKLLQRPCVSRQLVPVMLMMLRQASSKQPGLGWAQHLSPAQEMLDRVGL